MAQRPVYYGGQAVLEGVMIRGPRSMAVACRRPDGQILVRSEKLGGVYAGPLRRIPFLRGVIVLWETLALGLRSLVFSSNVAMGEEQKEVSAGTVWVTALVSLIVMAGLFFVGPVLLARWLDDVIESHLLVIVIEGLVRVGAGVRVVGGVGVPAGGERGSAPTR